MATNKVVSPTGKDIVLKPTVPNAGIEANYRKKLMALTDEMHESILYWVTSAYKANEPVALAQDDSPAMTLRNVMRKMATRWQSKFDDGADKLAKWFAQKNKDYTDGSMQTILKDAGLTVEFKMTDAVNDAYQAIIGENVNLIKSIASQHLTQVETMVMQSVQQGRDLGTLTAQLRSSYGVTKRRAALIARDQNNRATAIIGNVRQKSLGITQAVWRHSTGGKHPRESHVAANGKVFDIDKGMLIDGEYILPSTKINCRCTCAPIINGFIN